MIVAVLVATAVYDQGVVGVYTGDDAVKKARDAAEEIWPKTDGHHIFRIDVYEADKTHENVFQYYQSVGNVPPVEHVYRAGTMPERVLRPVSIMLNYCALPPEEPL